MTDMTGQSEIGHRVGQSEAGPARSVPYRFEPDATAAALAARFADARQPGARRASW